MTWRDEFLDDVESHCGTDGRLAVTGLLMDAEQSGYVVTRQGSPESKGLAAALVIRGLATWPDATPLIIFSKGRLSWQLKRLRTHKPFDIREGELRTRLQALPSTELAKADWPDTLIEDIKTVEGRRSLAHILDWVADRIRVANPG